MLTIKNIFKSTINYDVTNKLASINLRDCGIKLIDSLFYRLAYSQINVTKESIVSHLNYINNTNYSRQGYDGKERNIPFALYKLILNQLASYYNTFSRNNFQNILIAIDGDNSSYDEILNMGFYDVTNNVPIDIESFGLCRQNGRDGKNKEVKCATSYIKKYISKFKNTIIIGDRAYFSYKFMKFLNKNGIFFIIRSRGDANNLDPDMPIRKSYPNYKIIMYLRSKTRHIVCKNIVEKIVHNIKGKKNIKKYTIRMEDNCHIITNLLDNNSYPDNYLFTLYKSRWDPLVRRTLKYFLNI